MTPRYEVIAPYPKDETSGIPAFEKGTILLKIEKATNPYFSENGSELKRVILEDVLLSYPHLFRSLAWHEKRDINDMPEYVKCENAKGMYFAGKVMEWDFNNRLAIFSKYDNSKPKEVISFNRETKDFTPATATEYENFIKQKI